LVARRAAQALPASQKSLGPNQSYLPRPAVRDFTLQLKCVIAFYTSPSGRLFRQFIAEGQTDRQFLELFRQRFLKSRRDALRVIWQRGVDRGELRADVAKSAG
jgi:hypothetical protein